MAYKLSDFQPVNCTPGISQACKLLSLPAELRTQIFEYLTPHSTLVLPLRHHQSSGKDLYGETWDKVKKSFQGTEVYHISSKTELCNLGFLRTCRQIYAETATLLYSKCIFNITVRWDGAHILDASLEHSYPLEFRPWPATTTKLMRRMHVDVPIISKRTYDRESFMFEAYIDVRRNLRLLIDHLQSIQLKELTVDCFYLACWADNDDLLSADRLSRVVRETLHAFRSLRGLRKVTLRFHVLDSIKRLLYEVDTEKSQANLPNVWELFMMMRNEMTSDIAAATRPQQLTAEWTALDEVITLPKHALDVSGGLERLSRKLSPLQSDQSRRALQWTLDQAWSAADLGDSKEFAKAKRWVLATLARLGEDINLDFDDHHRRIEMDRQRINECFEGIISELAETAD